MSNVVIISFLTSFIISFLMSFSTAGYWIKPRSQLVIQVESRAEIQQLKERCKMLESVSFPATGLLDKEEFQSSDECYPNLDEVILIGGFDGSLWLSSLDSYSLSQDLMKSLSSIRSMCSYASTAKLNGELYIFGGVKGNLWSDIGIFLFLLIFIFFQLLLSSQGTNIVIL